MGGSMHLRANVPMALIFLIASIAFLGLQPLAAKAQTVVPIDVESMLNNTGIVAPMFCNAPLNSYQMVLVNGLPLITSATLVLQCTGCDDTTLPLDLSALDVTGILTIAAPTSCLITNRYCRVLMYVVDPFAEEGAPPVLVSQVESTCGVVPPNDYTAGCSWWDFACQMTNGEWYHYGPALTLYLAFVFIVLGLGTTTMLVFESNTHQFRLANVGKSITSNAGINQITYAKANQVQFQTNTTAPAQARPEGFTNIYSNAKGGASFDGSGSGVRTNTSGKSYSSSSSSSGAGQQHQQQQQYTEMRRRVPAGSSSSSSSGSSNSVDMTDLLNQL